VADQHEGGLMTLTIFRIRDRISACNEASSLLVGSSAITSADDTHGLCNDDALPLSSAQLMRIRVVNLRG